MNNYRVTSKLLVISSKKRLNNGEKWQNAKYGGIADEILKIHNLGVYINMLQTKNKSIQTIYFSITSYF